jgi:hypothetical protein
MKSSELSEVTAIEAARRLGVGLDYLYSLLWTRKLEGRKVGKQQATENQTTTDFVPMRLGDGQIIRSEDEMVNAYNLLVIAYNLLVSTRSGVPVPTTSTPTATYQPAPVPRSYYNTLPNTSFVPSVVPTTPSVTPQWTWNVDENRPGILLPATPGLPRMPSVDVGYGCWTSSYDVTTGQPVSVWLPSCSGN